MWLYLRNRVYIAEYIHLPHSTAITVRYWTWLILFSFHDQPDVPVTISTGYFWLFMCSQASVHFSRSSFREASSSKIESSFIAIVRAFSIMSIWIYSLIFCWISFAGVRGWPVGCSFIREYAIPVDSSSRMNIFLCDTLTISGTWDNIASSAGVRSISSGSSILSLCCNFHLWIKANYSSTISSNTRMRHSGSWRT